MPLEAGSDDATIRRNALEMIAAGHPEDQAWAAAYRKAGRKRKKYRRVGRPAFYDSRRADPAFGYGQPAGPAYVGIPGEQILHPEERRFLEGGRGMGRVGKYLPALRAAIEGRPGPLPTYDEVRAMVHAGKAVRGEYGRSAEHLAGMVGPENAALFGAASGIASAQTKWQAHTGGAMALLGAWQGAKRPTDPEALAALVKQTAGTMHGKTKPWAFALSNPKLSKLVALLGGHRQHLKSLSHLSSPDPRVRAKAARGMIAKTVGGQPSWKTPNFATASMPAPFGDPHGVPIDYAMAAMMVPTADELRDGYKAEVTKADTAIRKRMETAGNPGRLERFDPDGSIERAVENLLARHGMKGKDDLTHPAVEEIGRMRPPDTRESGRSPESKMVAVLKAAQARMASNPQYALAYKALVGQVAYDQGMAEARDAQETPWAAVMGVMGAKDFDPTGRVRPRELLAQSAVKANWNVLAALAHERSTKDLRAAGASQADVDDLHRKVRRELSLVKAGPVSLPGTLADEFDRVARRVPAGGFIGGEAGREVLEGLSGEGRLKVVGGKVRWAPGRGTKYARPRPGIPGSSYATAVSVARSRAALAISQAVSRSLGSLGVKPHRVTRAVLSAGGRFLPAAVASVYRPVPDKRAVAAAGWAGMMSQVPGVVAFSPHPQGPDILHRVEYSGQVGDLVKKLHAAGAYTHVLIPGRKGTTALVYDKGGRLSPYLAASGLNSAEARGVGVPMDRSELRDATRVAEMPG